MIASRAAVRPEMIPMTTTVKNMAHSKLRPPSCSNQILRSSDIAPILNAECQADSFEQGCIMIETARKSQTINGDPLILPRSRKGCTDLVGRAEGIGEGGGAARQVDWFPADGI